MSAIRAMYVDDGITRWDLDGVRPTDGWLREGDTLGVLLGRIGHLAHPHGLTLLISEATKQRLGLPARLPDMLVGDHPALNSARATGWKTTKIRPWMTFYRDQGPSIHIGVVPWLTRRTFPWWHAEPDPMVTGLYQFHRITSTAYHGANSGLAAQDIMREQHSGRVPMWKPKWDGVQPAMQATEVAPVWDSHTEHGLAFEHMYDARLQFLTTSGHIPLALSELVFVDYRGHPDAFRATRPGYYRVSTPPWAYSSVLPHPIGNNPMIGATRWVTLPTLQLLHELAEHHQVLAEPDVLDAWVCGDMTEHGKVKPASGRVLRGWTEQVRSAVEQAERFGDPVVLEAVKGLYKHGFGMLETHDARVRRPDWSHSVIGLSRANMWRKMWQTYVTSGRTPVRVEADQVWYASDHENPDTDWPSAFPKVPEKGGYQHKATTKVRIGGLA